MNPGSIGYNYSHNSDFVMDRPNGPGCWLMLIVKTPANFTINGRDFAVRENSFVLISPDAPCRYCAAGDTYTDDWIYFSPEKDTPRRFGELDIPVNEPVYLGDTSAVSQIIHILAFEHFCAEPFHIEIERHYTEILLLSVSRIIHSNARISSKMFIERNYRMTQLRSTIYTDTENVMSIDEMAEFVNMSRSGFQHLYKRMFGTGVINDVINGRIERAKRLLSATNMTVAEIASKCGYSTEYNFMRQFKKRTGKTPTEYRKQI